MISLSHFFSNKINASLHSFRKCCSTSTNSVTCPTAALDCLPTLIPLTHLTLPHSLLLKKLPSSGLSPNHLPYLQADLSSILLQSCIMKSGVPVPEGCPLGPLLLNAALFLFLTPLLSCLPTTLKFSVTSEKLETANSCSPTFSLP